MSGKETKRDERNVGGKDAPAGAREWLGRARGLGTEIRAYELALREIRERTARITRAPQSETRRGTPDAHKQEKPLELEDELREKLEELNRINSEICGAIWKLKSTKQRTVLFSYYVRCLTLEQIAEEMDCSVRNVQNLRKRGEREIEGML